MRKETPHPQGKSHKLPCFLQEVRYQIPDPAGRVRHCRTEVVSRSADSMPSAVRAFWRLNPHIEPEVQP